MMSDEEDVTMMSDEEDDVGIKFDPYDVELIRDFLMKKIKNEPCGDEGEYIVSKDVYAKEPWLLDHKNKDNFFKEDEWFYFATRTQVSKLKTGCGKNLNRTIKNGRGNWKANDGETYIKDERGEVIGKKLTLTFKKTNNKKQKLGDNNDSTICVDSSWIMDEYWLAEKDRFQQLVLCKIHKKKKSKKKDEAIGSGDQDEELFIESEKDDDQVYPNPLPSCFTPAFSSLQRQEGQRRDWLQDFEDSCYTQEEPVPASSSQHQ